MTATPSIHGVSQFTNPLGFNSCPQGNSFFLGLALAGRGKGNRIVLHKLIILYFPIRPNGRIFCRLWTRFTLSTSTLRVLWITFLSNVWERWIFMGFFGKTCQKLRKLWINLLLSAFENFLNQAVFVDKSFKSPKKFFDFVQKEGFLG